MWISPPAARSDRSRRDHDRPIIGREAARHQILGAAVTKYDVITIPSTMKKFHDPTVTGVG